ncbi:transmembrane and ubiquitin-like domain-containing protein 1 [Ptychodera flava]|uniref:transmembrane and ubiquitin-like domain-containing protein 1 n=1 Tax=Ptychodera flava TaxID=63121 RepID=UPI00396A5688
MPLIEGIGDEVTIAAVAMTLVVTVLVAWWSTFVGDRPLHVHIIRRSNRISPRQRRRYEQLQRQRGSETSDSVSEAANSGASEDVNADSANVNESSVAESAEEGSENIQQDVSGQQGNTDTPNTNSQKMTSVPQNMAGESGDGDVEIIGAVADTECVTRTHGEFGETELRNRRTGEQIFSSADQNRTLSQSTEDNVQSLSQNLRDNSSAIKEREQTVESSVTESTTQASPPEHERPDEGNDVPSPDDETQRTDPSEADNAGMQDEVPANHIRIRLKFLNESERMVFARPQDTLGQFRREKFAQEILAGRTVRFIFNGHLLREDNQRLLDFNISDNSVLHCHISHGTSAPAEPAELQNVDIDLGRFMVPLFGFILLSVWYLRWQYRYMFNATSTIALIAVSLLFVLAVLAAWRS